MDSLNVNVRFFIFFYFNFIIYFTFAFIIPPPVFWGSWFISKCTQEEKSSPVSRRNDRKAYKNAVMVKMACRFCCVALVYTRGGRGSCVGVIYNI